MWKILWLVICGGLAGGHLWSEHSREWGFGQNRQYAAALDDPPTVDIIPRLDSHELDQQLAKKPILVIFYATWCAACRRYLHEVNRLISFNKYTQFADDYPIVAVDVDRNSDVLGDWGIEWLPATLLLGEALSEPLDYQGDNTAEALSLWLKNPQSSSRTNLIDFDASSSMFQQFTDFADTLIVICGVCDAGLKDQIKTQLDPLPIISATQCNQFEPFGFNEEPKECVLLYRHRHEWPWVNQRVPDVPDLGKLISAASPIRLSRQNAQATFGGTLPVLLAVHPSNLTESERQVAHTKLMRLKRPNLVIAETGCETPFERRMFDYLGLSGLFETSDSTALSFRVNPLLTLFVPQPTFLANYSMVGATKRSREIEWTQPSLVDARTGFKMTPSQPGQNWFEAPLRELQGFLNLALSGAIAPEALRSEPKEVRRDGEVVHLSSQGLQKLINAGKTDMIVYLYANWCSHCYKVRPIFTQTAQRFSNTGLLFATLNLENNSMPPFRIQLKSGETMMAKLALDGLPAILIIDKDLKSPILYDGERSTEALANFLHRHFMARTRSEL